MQFQLLAIALAASATASPFMNLNLRQTGQDITYNCSTYLSTCDLQNPGDPGSVCKDRFDACQGCTSKEHACRVGADYSQQLNCTIGAQQCYQNTTSIGTVSGAYGCEQAFETCKDAPQENNAFCASQKSGCDECAKNENACRTAPGANQAQCSADAQTCYNQAITFN